MIISLSLVLLLLAIVLLYVRQDKFGKAPSGQRLERILKSPNYRDGKFQNLSVTPDLAEGYTMLGVMYTYFFTKRERRRPVDVIPSVKTDLHAIPLDSNVLVWFGHSSYFMQIDGKKFLVDPVFSGNASPIPASNKSFRGTDIYTAGDFPEIDYLLISHDHYDHVDYETLIALKPKVKKVICGLGVGSHFEHWGYSSTSIVETDWHESLDLGDNIKLFTAPARHFSGRGLIRNNTLWQSYLLQSSKLKIYIGGDSGYDTHYASIGDRFGPIDLAILDNGQYDSAWHYIHNLPEEVLKASKDLQAKRLFPVHSSKFALGNHPWDEPLKKITSLNKNYNIPLVTPIIGEVVNLNDDTQMFTPWWIGIN